MYNISCQDLLVFSVYLNTNKKKQFFLLQILSTAKIILAKINLVNPIRDGSSRVTSTNVRVIPQNFLTCSYNPFATLV